MKKEMSKLNYVCAIFPTLAKYQHYQCMTRKLWIVVEIHELHIIRIQNYKHKQPNQGNKLNFDQEKKEKGRKRIKAWALKISNNV